MSIVILTGCTATTTSANDDALSQITEAIEHKDYASALSILDNTRQAVIDSPDVNKMVDYSIIYMKLSDINDSAELVGYAYVCMSKAFATDSATTADYINTLPTDELSQASAVKTLLGASGICDFHGDAEYPDSIYLHVD